ncbi:MAG: hypothetical protein NZ869_11465, partial [Thermoanaerobaculum sp.]|nr:hypothetical protein [Thermoanaerobaculum sp.]
DFGIYRILNHKRAVIEEFIQHKLPQMVQEALQEGALGAIQHAQQRLAEIRAEIERTFGADAINADGSLHEAFRETPLGKKYLEALAHAQGARTTESLEAEVYNHLYAFFSRYWQDGDFISKRRYGHKERYAIPYNG